MQKTKIDDMKLPPRCYDGVLTLGHKCPRPHRRSGGTRHTEHQRTATAAAARTRVIDDQREEPARADGKEKVL